jgi:hypothetical protein
MPDIVPCALKLSFSLYLALIRESIPPINPKTVPRTKPPIPISAIKEKIIIPTPHIWFFLGFRWFSDAQNMMAIPDATPVIGTTNV